METCQEVLEKAHSLGISRLREVSGEHGNVMQSCTKISIVNADAFAALLGSHRYLKVGRLINIQRLEMRSSCVEK